MPETKLCKALMSFTLNDQSFQEGNFYELTDEQISQLPVGSVELPISIANTASNEPVPNTGTNLDAGLQQAPEPTTPAPTPTVEGKNLGQAQPAKREEKSWVGNHKIPS